MNRIRNLVGVVLASCALMTACASPDDLIKCVPIGTVLDGPGLFKRVSDSRDYFNKQRDPTSAHDEEMGKMTCVYTVSAPGQTPVSQTLEDVPVRLTDLNRCFDLSGATSMETLMSCLIVQSLTLIRLTVDDQLMRGGITQDMLSAVKITGVKCAPTELKLVPDKRFLNREILLLPVLIQLIQEGGQLVPSPASIPLLFPGTLPGHGEEACVDLPAEPAKRCADTTGCPETPDGAEEPDPDDGDVIPPGTDPEIPPPDTGDGI